MNKDDTEDRKEAPMDILVSEVGPRDGLQSIKRTMPTEMKIRWIEALALRQRLPPSCVGGRGVM